VHTRCAYVTFKHGKYLLRTDQEDERIYVRQPRSQMCTVTGNADWIMETVHALCIQPMKCSFLNNNKNTIILKSSCLVSHNGWKLELNGMLNTKSIIGRFYWNFSNLVWICFIKQTFYKLLTGQIWFPITMVARYNTSTLPSHSNTSNMCSNSLGIFPFVMGCLLFRCKSVDSSARESHKSPQTSLAIKPRRLYTVAQKERIFKNNCNFF